MQLILVEKKHKSYFSEYDLQKLFNFKRINFIDEQPIDFLSQLSSKVFAKILKNMLELDRLGIAAKRPLVDYLRDDIYELRTGLNNINYRLLYFFDGLDIILITNGLTKDREVPNYAIDKAVDLKNLYFKSKSNKNK